MRPLSGSGACRPVVCNKTLAPSARLPNRPAPTPAQMAAPRAEASATPTVTSLPVTSLIICAHSRLRDIPPTSLVGGGSGLATARTCSILACKPNAIPSNTARATCRRRARSFGANRWDSVMSPTGKLISWAWKTCEPKVERTPAAPGWDCIASATRLATGRSASG